MSSPTIVVSVIPAKYTTSFPFHLVCSSRDQELRGVSCYYHKPPPSTATQQWGWQLPEANYYEHQCWPFLCFNTQCSHDLTASLKRWVHLPYLNCVLYRNFSTTVCCTGSSLQLLASALQLLAIQGVLHYKCQNCWVYYLPYKRANRIFYTEFLAKLSHTTRRQREFLWLPVCL